MQPRLQVPNERYLESIMIVRWNISTLSKKISQKITHNQEMSLYGQHQSNVLITEKVNQQANPLNT